MEFVKVLDLLWRQEWLSKDFLPWVFGLPLLTLLSLLFIVCTNVTASQRGLLVFLSYSTAGFPFCFLFPFLTVKIFNLSGKMKKQFKELVL